MRKFLLPLVLVLSANAGDFRDGTDWKHYRPGERQAWALGWMDGACEGEEILGSTAADTAAYHAALIKFSGMQADELVQGMNQFYGADYRNLAIPMPQVALLVALYARGMDAAEAVALAAALRARYQAAK